MTALDGPAAYGAAGLPATLAALLRCPADGSPLRIEEAPGGQALLVGEAIAYPVLLGIPRLIDDPLRRQLVALLRAGRRDAAERLVLRWPTFSLGPRIRRRLARELGALAPEAVWLGVLLSRFADGGAIRAPHASFTELVRRHGTGFYPDWFAYRFGARTFLPITGLAGLLPPGGPILEIGTGCGHSSFVLGRHAGPGTVVALDHQFAQLHAARRFMAPDAHYVCTDVERGLPLASGAFAAVVMSDTFHFVHEKQRLAEEVARVTRPRSTLLLSQIHNGLFPEPFAGEPLSPADYSRMFAGWEPRLLRNDRLLDRLSTDDGFDLTDPALAAGIEGERSLSLVGRRGGGGAAAVAEVSRHVSERRTRIVLNPALTRTERGLAPREDIHPVVAPNIAPPDMAGLAPGAGEPPAWEADSAATIDLLRRRVLLDVPERFL